MVDFIVEFISRSGYLGVFLLMALENIFPPIPSEMIMPFAGFVASKGDLNVIGVLLAGTAGSVAGALPWYYAGKLLGRERLTRAASKYGRWLTVTLQEMEKSITTFESHGKMTIFFGRIVPAVRTLISVPAGLTEMPLPTFLAYTTAGSLIWSGALVGAGFLLEKNYSAVARYVDPAAKTVVAVIVIAYLYRFFTQKKGEK